MFRIFKSVFSGLIGAMVLLAFTKMAYADEMGTESPAFINGGIGQEEAVDFRANASRYNLRLYFSEAKKGQSITGVAVKVGDKKGNIKLDIASAGPMLFMNMENGTYKVVCQYKDVLLTKIVKVINHRGVNVYLNWKNSAVDAIEFNSNN